MREFDLSRILDRYELIETKEIDEIKSTGLYFKHIKSGARVCVLSNEDDNKVFSIGFRTPPADSTGVAHILEHSVLCGSKKFPVKDPFIELAKGSLNTFLNAMTYPDKTVYPVASYNDKDFANLCDIYMDAVLHPNIYDKPEIFYQEGWRYEVSDEGEFSVNGVVYNEMKGVFSSPEQILVRALSTSLFPDTPYGKESGGDPVDIPKLTYEQFLDFHRTYYHPSNSYISFYGDMDVTEKLDWLDKSYLKEYDKIEVDSKLPYQKAFEETKVLRLNYPCTEKEELEGHNYLAYNAVYEDSLADEICIAMEVLSYYLLDCPGAPLKKKLLAKKICKDVLGGSNNGILQPFFTIAIKDSKLNDDKEFKQIVKDTLREILSDGLDSVALSAAISRFEFSHREASFDSQPKGLIYSLNMLDSWLYDDSMPFDKLFENNIYKSLKEKADKGFFEEIIEKYLLNNTHESVVILTPDLDYNNKLENELRTRLNEVREALSEKELEVIKENAIKLKKYQEKVDTKEELLCIPRLKREDLSDKVPQTSNIELEDVDCKCIYHDVNSNGISYIDLFFDLGELDSNQVCYAGLFDAVFAAIGTKKHSINELTTLIDLNTGGISSDCASYKTLKEEKAGYYTRISTRVLKGKVKEALKIIGELILEIDFEDYEQLQEIIMETKSRLAMEVNGAAHQMAIRMAGACLSSDGAFTELTKGMSFYEFIYDLEENFEAKKEEIATYLKDFIDTVFTKENLTCSITCDKENLDEVKEEIKEFATSIDKTLESGGLGKTVKSSTKMLKNIELTFKKENKAVKLPGQVCFVGRCGSFNKEKYSGAFSVLKTILGYEYLWKNVREQGGAYGCMCAFLRNGKSYLVSYRDPNLSRTLGVYDKITDYIEGFCADEEEMTKYIIGAISNIDTPLTPIMKGRRDMTNYFVGLSDDEIKKSKLQVIGAKSEDIRALKDTVWEFLNTSVICVLGDTKKIEEAKDLFDNIIEFKM